MNTVQSRIVRRLQAAARTVYSLRPDVRSAAWLLAAGILCASDVGFGRMSLGASLLAACPSSALAACCLGVLAGSAAVFGLPGCLGPCAVAAAVLCARLLAPKKYTGAASAAAAAVAEILTGLYGLFLARFSLTSLLLLGAHAALSAGAVILFRAALVRGAYAARVAAVCTLLPALSSFRLPGGWSAAAVALAWAVWGSTGTVYACIGCAVMAALTPASAACFACLGVAALIGQALASKPVPAAGIACGIYAVFGIRTAHPGFIVCAAAGTALALVLPPDRFLPRPAPTKLPATPAQRELRRAAAAMRLASDMLHTREADPRRTFAGLAEAGAAQLRKIQRLPKNRAMGSSPQRGADPYPGRSVAGGSAPACAVHPSRGPAHRRQRRSGPGALRAAYPQAAAGGPAGRPGSVCPNGRSSGGPVRAALRAGQPGAFLPGNCRAGRRTGRQRRLRGSRRRLRRS